MAGGTGDNARVAAIAWSLVGLMAASLGVLSAALYSGLNRIDALGARLDGRMDSLGARLDGLGARLDGRIDTLSGRIDAMGSELRADIQALRDHVH
jgi:hypothetical protein